MARCATAWVLLLCAGVGTATAVSPVEKVIELLGGLLEEIETTGKEDARTYDSIACECKTNNKEKSDSILEWNDRIEEYAADMQQQRAVSDDMAKAIESNTAKLDMANKEIATIESDREVEKATYERSSADLGAGVEALEGAIEDAEAGETGFVQLDDGLVNSLVVADALGLVPEESKKVVSAALMQTGATDPEEGGEGYSFHAQDLIETFKKLDNQFSSKKAEVDQMEEQNKKNFEDVMKTKTEGRETLEELIKSNKEEKATADKKFAKAQDGIIEMQAKLKDDSLYMHALTKFCELKAREWDQRTSMRADEKTALSKALEIINNKVKDVEQKRAFLQNNGKALPEPPMVNVEDDDVGDMAFSFLQETHPRRKLQRLHSLVQSKAKGKAQLTDNQQQSIIDKLMIDSKRLGSPSLALVAMSVGADPFKKVKKLIQGLIEKLVQEAADEATKKGWCDTELGKAELNQMNNMDKVKKINAETANLEAVKGQIHEQLTVLIDEIAELEAQKAKAKAQRLAENVEAIDTITKAKAGRDACKEALEVLKAFYKQAGKAKAVLLLQRNATTTSVNATKLLQHFPSANATLLMQQPNKGHQQASSSILDLLEVIIGDFDRSVQVNEKVEKQSFREYTTYAKQTNALVGSKESQKSSLEFSEKETTASINEGMMDLEKHQKLLDDALKELEDLNPSCVNTGMSYEERVQKRNEEIDALNDALCQLDTDKVEDECQ